MLHFTQPAPPTSTCRCTLLSGSLLLLVDPDPETGLLNLDWRELLKRRLPGPLPLGPLVGGGA